MFDPHDQIIPGPGRNAQPGGQGAYRQQRVIAHGAKRRRYALEQPGAGMMDIADTAMHWDGRPLHGAAKTVADALVTQANAKDRPLLLPDQMSADAEIGIPLRCAGAGGKNDVVVV